MAKKYRITILNWEKYQPRGDVKHSSWYRKEHKIHFDPDWAHLDGQELQVWDHLLALASLKNKATFRMDYEQLAKGAKVPVEKVVSAIEKLEDDDLQCVKIDGKDSLHACDDDDTDTLRDGNGADTSANEQKKLTKNSDENEPENDSFDDLLDSELEESFQQDPVDVTSTVRGRSPTDGRTNERLMVDFQKSTDPDELSLLDDPEYEPHPPCKKANGKANGEDLDSLRDEIYKIYPRRGQGQNMGKGAGMKKLKSIRSKEKLERIKTAAQNYADAQVKNGNAGTPFTMQFKTFMNNWEEWEKPEEDQPKEKEPIVLGNEEWSRNEDSLL